MKRRITTLAAVVGLAALSVTVLVAAREAGDKSHDSPVKPANGLKKLVCIGHVDVKDRVVAIYPDNFPQPAKVTEVLVKEGATVTAKQPLLKFDNEMLVLKVQEAEAAMKAASADQEKADAMIRAHQSQVVVLEKELLAEEAKLDAKKKLLEETRRAVKLGQRNPVELEEPEAAVKAADFTLIAARLKWDNAKVEEPTYLRRAAEASLRRAEVLKAQAEHARDQMVCKAPANGRIIRSFVSEGHLFGPASRDPAFWFLKEGPPIIRAEVTQEFANRVTEGQSAKIEDEADPKQFWKGKVVKVPDQFLPKRFGNTGLVDLMPVNDERVLECQVSIELGPGETPPRYGQKVRVTLGE
jgi:multidrug resistance efflux pump